ncbi:MAG TPA: FAD-binding protein [Polyangiaceae bacterium]|nr:FAD-binding protein [Polyangiaceae bacterium]
MTNPSLVVVGAGMAGTAAAFAATERGASVTVLHDRAGATALTSGALDLEPWDGPLSFQKARHERDAGRDEELGAFLAALGIYRRGGAEPRSTSMVATASGVVRPAFGIDGALLDLSPLAGRRIAVADVERDDWDAPLLAKTLGVSAWAERTGASFVPVPLDVLQRGHERRIAAYDFAVLHDDPARRSALAEAVKARPGVADAWLFGPWLGLEPDTVETLRALAGLPLGETTSPLGGPAGARFERARDRLWAARRVDVRRARVTAIEMRGARFGVRFETPEGTSELEAASVVLATGGVGAGGVTFTWSRPGVVRGFEFPLDAPVTLALDGEALGGGGSLYGPSLETLGLGVLERVGVACDDFGRPVGMNSAESRLFVAGDAVAGRPRTMLEAALAGLAAGNVAVRG